MTRHDLLALQRAQTRLRIAYDLLGDVWNESLPRDLREAIGQDHMKPVMQWLHDRIESLEQTIHQAAEEKERA